MFRPVCNLVQPRKEPIELAVKRKQIIQLYYLIYPI